MVGLNKRPNGMWYVRYVVDGKLVNKSLRTRNPQEAKRRAKEIEDSLAPVQAAEQKAPARQGAGVPSNFPKLAREEQIRIGILAALGRLGNKDIATEIGCVRPALTRFLSGGTMTASLLDNAELWLRSNGFWFWDESGVVDRTEVNKFPEHGDPWDVAMAALQHLVALVSSDIPPEQKLRMLQGSWTCFGDMLTVIEDYVREHARDDR